MSINNPHANADENLEKYQVHSTLEMGRIFNGLMQSNQRFRMTFPGKQEAVTVSILNVDAKGREMFLELPADPVQRGIILKSNLIGFESQLDKITISFTLSQVFADMFQGASVMRVPFPDRLTRLQRRESFRISTANSTIRIPTNASVFTGEVRNLSFSGLNIVDKTLKFDSTIGKVYPNCKLQLQGVEPLTVTIEIRNSFDVALADKSRQRRIGCMFVELPKAVEALIQRYITQLERQRRR